MVSAFSFASENSKVITVEQSVQNVLVVENNVTESFYLTADELMTYCWTTVTMTTVGEPYTDMAGDVYQDVIVRTRTTCITV